MIFLVVYVLCNKRISWVLTVVKAGYNVCKFECIAWKMAYMQLNSNLLGFEQYFELVGDIERLKYLYVSLNNGFNKTYMKWMPK